MCGIAGIISFDGNIRIEQLQKMANSLAHRGPDDFGYWLERDATVGLAHRRLSIQDLSAMGKQPMYSTSERYVVCYNGEIYNFEELRSSLNFLNPGHQWRGNSDTEVLLACIEFWGLSLTLSKLVGMFAIALWDREDRLLYLARDRMGEKPLYYGKLGGKFVFASELKAIRSLEAARLEINRAALAEYMQFGYVMAPRSIYNDIHKLPSAHYLCVSFKSTEVGVPVPFWVAPSPEHDQEKIRLEQCTDRELTDFVHDTLQSSIALQTVADVPHGAFLSGGIDSSTVVGIMQAQSSRPIRTFTIGFDDPKLNEAPHAAAVAAHLGTEHTEMFVTGRDAEGVISALPFVYDEPFADSSQIPTLLVSRLTRQHVTVALSGDGGDELFAGYPRYQLTESLWQRSTRIPHGARKIAARGLRALSPQAWDRMLSVLPETTKRHINGRRLHHLAGMGACDSLGEMYIRLMTRWQPEDELVIGANVPSSTSFNLPAGIDNLDALRRWDISRYLQDDLLVKVDRASMNASLETRAPMLDHRVVELALNLPRRVLVRDGVGKWVLRQVLDRYVPRALIERPKAGFEVPLAQWLRGDLKSWAESLLNPERIRNEGYLNVKMVQDAWLQHQAGIADRSLHLWHILMFEMWLDSLKEQA